ncbi:hypothetical protein ABMA27_005600 [Loxostege sticticalis]|uniref:CRAL-TRIO domain-containing protein n=1 Tax=Loxostege sticticalis TaxID=481309 RepID=A0ABR3HJS8_LOXSC
MAEKKSQEEIEKLMVQFREWINSQPHLPKDLEDRLLMRFLHSCYYDLEKAKSAAELFFSIRAASPDLLKDRDPSSPQMQKALKIVNLAQLRVAGKRNLWIWQLNDPGLENFDYLQDARLFFLTTDAWLLNEEVLEEEDIVIMDVKDVTLKILAKFNLSIARTLSKYQQDAIPIRLKQVHVINAPSFIDKIFGLVKPFLKQGMTDMIHFHSPKSETLYKYLNKEDLPEDYGGSNGKMEDHMKEVMEVIMSKREFLTENLWKAEKKSKNKASKEAKETSFRSLDID